MTRCGGFSCAVRDKPDYRVVHIPVMRVGRARYEFWAPYTLQPGARLIDCGTTQVGKQSYCRLIFDISEERGDNLPPMPEGWDYRDLMRR